MTMMRNLPGPYEARALAPEGPRAVGVPLRATAAEDEASGAPLGTVLLHYAHLALKHKALIGICCGLSLFGGVVATLLSTKIFSAATTVKIDRAAPKVFNTQMAPLEASSDAQFYQTQYELIKSRAIAERVAANLALAQTDFIAPPPSFTARLKNLVGLGTDPARAPVQEPAVAERTAQAVGRIMAGLAVQPVAQSSIVRIVFSGASPEWAQRISVAVAEAYERSILDRRFSASQHARSFLEEQLQQLKVKLQDSERQLIAYAQKEGIVEPDSKVPTAPADLLGLQGALAAAVTERIRAEQLLQVVQGPNGMNLPQVVDDLVVTAARSRKVQLQAAYQEKLNLLKPAFPEMVALKSQIAEVDQQIRSASEAVKARFRASYEQALAQETALRAKLEEVKGQTLELRGRSVEYTILQREVDTARSLYEGLLQQFRELSVAGDVDTNNVSIVDKALRPGIPDSPVMSRNLLIALVIGLALAGLLVAVIEVLDDTFKTPESLEHGAGLAVLGVTPKGPVSDDRSAIVRGILADARSPMSESFRSLRTAVQFSTEEGAPKSLLVTSAKPGEGKSTTALCLAINFANLGQNVLLIDADLRNPSLHKMLGVPNDRGLTDHLTGAAEAAELVVETEVEGLSVLSAGKLPPNPAELLHGPRFGSLIASACGRFDLVVVDGPPVMGLADAPIIASRVGATVLVVAAAETRRAVVQDALKRIEFARGRLIGSVLNKFDARRAGFSYGYGYGYGPYGTAYYAYQKAPEALPRTGA